jgi:hypothetical protein
MCLPNSHKRASLLRLDKRKKGFMAQARELSESAILIGVKNFSQMLIKS